MDLIRDISEEERRARRTNQSKESGYTGLSILHRLYPLYGFLYDKHTVYDEMHLLYLNVVKRGFQQLSNENDGNDDENLVDFKSVDVILSEFPWTKGKIVISRYRKSYDFELNL